MKDEVFHKILITLLIVGIVSVITLIVLTMVFHSQVSIITFIEKEPW